LTYQAKIKAPIVSKVATREMEHPTKVIISNTWWFFIFEEFPWA